MVASSAIASTGTATREGRPIVVEIIQMITPMWMSSGWTITAYTGYRSASVEVISADLATSTSDISVCSLVATIPEKKNIFIPF